VGSLKKARQNTKTLLVSGTYIARDNPAAAERFGLALVEKADC
jgi:hypothetical protein